MCDEDDDICGLCDGAGADKIPHPCYWPGEQRPGTELVHAECERIECERAFAAFRQRVGDEGVRRFLRSI